jgi:hypothetical protein
MSRACETAREFSRLTRVKKCWSYIASEVCMTGYVIPGISYENVHWS